MRINDGSICSDCEYFEHECDYDCCYEYCHCNDEETIDHFTYDGDEIITECKYFEEDK